MLIFRFCYENIWNVLTSVKIIKVFNVNRVSKMAVFPQFLDLAAAAHADFITSWTYASGSLTLGHLSCVQIMCYLREVWWTAGQSIFSSSSWRRWCQSCWCSRMSWHKVTDHMCHCDVWCWSCVFSDRKRLLWAPPVYTHVPPTNTLTHGGFHSRPTLLSETPQWTEDAKQI